MPNSACERERKSEREGERGRERESEGERERERVREGEREREREGRGESREGGTCSVGRPCAAMHRSIHRVVRCVASSNRAASTCSRVGVSKR
jgi:hypothetical protein